jgi:proteasome inhibitor subunit 1 (PI31)
MPSDILDPSALISLLPALLPPSTKKLNTPQDGLAALLHTAMVAVGFRLIGVDDSTAARQDLNNILPAEWSHHSPGNFTFRYKHEQSSLEFVVKVAKLGSRTLVNAIAVEVGKSDLPSEGRFLCLYVYQSEKAASLDISTNDFVSPSFFPHDPSAPNAAPLVHGFISSNRIADFMFQLKVKIIQKLTPGLRKEGYVEESEDTSSGSSSQLRTGNLEPSRPRPRPYPEGAPYIPDHPEHFPYQSRIPPENPLSIGRRDLDPFPQNPFSPPPLFSPNRGDGMFVGPDHPIFGGGRVGGVGGVNGRRWGGDGFLPPMGAPPGARFDPVGPGIGPFPGAGGIQGPPNRRNFHGEPDNDDFMPPGAVCISYSPGPSPGLTQLYCRVICTCKEVNDCIRL